MKGTFILKDLSEKFFSGFEFGGEHVTGLDELPDVEKLKHLFGPRCRDLQITSKIGNGSFRDRVELNQLMRGPFQATYKLEPRRGYKLATFEVSKV